MSFNNPLGFNVSKAIPTTSTTNTNTTSTATSQNNSPSPSRHGHNDQLNLGKANWKDLSESMKLNASSGSSPKVLQPALTTELSEVTPTTVKVTEHSNGPREKTDLIGLFDKFDVNIKSDMDDDEVEVDSLEEKMKQFKPKPRQNSNLSTLTDNVDEKDHLSTCTEPAIEEQLKVAKTIEGASAGNDQNDASTVTEQPQQPMTEKKVIDDSSENGQDESSNSNWKSTNDTGDVQQDNETELAQPNRPGDDEVDVLKDTQSETVQDYQIKESELPSESSAAPMPLRPRQRRNNSIQRTYDSINPQEQYQKSHRPFDFQVFLSHIRNKSADPLVRYIRSFLVSFTRQAPAMSSAQRIKAVRQFKEFINGKFQEFEPFASMDSKDLENSNEGIEKLIMNRLYEYTFSPEVFNKNESRTPESFLQDLRDDVKFTTQLDKFSWVSGPHLDVDLNEISQRKRESSKESLNYLDQAINELNKINNYRAPRDKIICILNSCKIIFSLLRVSKQETNADAFIPLLILVIIRAKTPNLISNIHYIERFRGEQWLLHGETSYYLSSIQGAITFIQNITRDDLTVSDEEYEANIEAWEADIRQRPPYLIIPEPRASDSPPESGPIVRTNLSPSSVLMASAETFKKSISNYLSPPPQESSQERATQRAEEREGHRPSEEDVDAAFGQLSEMFPTLDKAILRDLVVMNEANVEKTLDVCLQLVNES